MIKVLLEAIIDIEIPHSIPCAGANIDIEIPHSIPCEGANICLALTSCSLSSL